MKAIFHRISTRKYESKAVEPEKITQLMKAAMAAPSACNQQPWEFYVVTDPDTIAALSRSTPYATPAGKAPLVIVPCFRNQGLVAPGFANIDMSACVENLLLEADSLGLGTCWMGVSPTPVCMQAVADILHLPETLSAFCLISVGYPAETRPQEDRYDVSRVHFI